MTAQDPAAGDLVVEMKDVSRSFPGPREVVAVRGVDVGIRHGDYVSIMGPSGSGKSTFLNLLGLLDTPTLGSYRLDGIDITGMSDKARTQVRGRRIGFVFQAFHLLPRRTVFDNVLGGMAYSGVPRAERSGRAERALEQVSMGHRAEFFPTTLSGGERQRVSVARAIAGRPSLLLADEPTGNLDAATSQGILDLFDQLNRRGLTIVLVSHDPVVAARAGRRMVMTDGRLEEVAP